MKSAAATRSDGSETGRAPGARPDSADGTLGKERSMPLRPWLAARGSSTSGRPSDRWAGRWTPRSPSSHRNARTCTLMLREREERRVCETGVAMRQSTRSARRVRLDACKGGPCTCTCIIPRGWPSPPHTRASRNAVDVMMDMAHDMIMKRVYTWHAHTRIIGWTGMPGHAR